MEVKLEKRYPVNASPAQAWAVLRDVHAVAGCMPGAAITEQIDATHFKGAVKLKIGPATAAFAGDIEVLALDEAAQHMQMLGKGADRAGSTASMNLSAKVEPGENAGSAVLVGNAVVTVNGKFAQFGGRMMVQVSDMILAQFAGNFTLAAAAVPVAADIAATPTVAAPAPPGAQALPSSSASGDAASAQPAPTAASPVASTASNASSAPAPASASASASASRPQAAQPQTELNGLAIVWALVKGWFAGLFGKRG